MCKESKIHKKSQKEEREPQNRTRSFGLPTAKELSCVRLKEEVSASSSFQCLSCLGYTDCALLSAPGLNRDGESHYSKLPSQQTAP